MRRPLGWLLKLLFRRAKPAPRPDRPAPPPTRPVTFRRCGRCGLLVACDWPHECPTEAWL